MKNIIIIIHILYIKYYLFEEIYFEHVLMLLYIVFNCDQCSITEHEKNFEQ